jgi:hypothetical protein
LALREVENEFFVGFVNLADKEFVGTAQFINVLMGEGVGIAPCPVYQPHIAAKDIVFARMSCVFLKFIDVFLERGVPDDGLQKQFVGTISVAKGFLDKVTLAHQIQNEVVSDRNPVGTHLQFWQLADVGLEPDAFIDGQQVSLKHPFKVLPPSAVGYLVVVVKEVLSQPFSYNIVGVGLFPELYKLFSLVLLEESMNFILWFQWQIGTRQQMVVTVGGCLGSLFKQPHFCLNLRILPPPDFHGRQHIQLAFADRHFPEKRLVSFLVNHQENVVAFIVNQANQQLQQSWLIVTNNAICVTIH